MERLNRLREVSSETGVGLAGMRERLNELNGKLERDSDAHGTNLRAIVPMPPIARSIPEDSKGIAFNHRTTADAFLMVNRTGLTFSAEQAV